LVFFLVISAPSGGFRRVFSAEIAKVRCRDSGGRDRGAGWLGGAGRRRLRGEFEHAAAGRRWVVAGLGIITGV